MLIQSLTVIINVIDGKDASVKVIYVQILATVMRLLLLVRANGDTCLLIQKAWSWL